MTKISDLIPLAPETIDGTEDVPVVKGGVTRRAKLSQLSAATISQASGHRVRAGNAVPFATWAALAAATGMVAGDRATVRSTDTGTHTDPVVGGTVANAGVYTYSASPAGWQRVGNLDTQDAAAQVALANTAAAAAQAVAPLSIAPSIMAGNDFRTGSTGWNVSGFSTTNYTANGLEATRVYASGGTTWTGRIFKTVAGGGVSLVAGRRYAMFVDLTLENNGESQVATVEWRPFLLTGPGVSTVAKRIPVGAVGTPIRAQYVTRFDEIVTGTRGNPYTDLLGARNAQGNNLAAFDIDIIYHTFMMVDLGVAGDPLYDLTDAQVADWITRAGAPYHPSAGGGFELAALAARATRATNADRATSSAAADLATLAEATRSPYQNKRILTLGHSLVSQVAWQPALGEMLSLEGWSVQGTAGGTLQPKPSENVKGMFSRAAMASLLSGIINFRDAGANNNSTTGLTAALKLRTAATIFWTGANDSLMDAANSPYQRLAANREKIASLEARAIALSVGHFVSTAAGLSGTTLNQYFTVDGAVAGFRVLYLHRNTGSPLAQPIYHYPHAGTAFDTDRIMTTAEQDEFEARNTAQGANAFLSSPLTNGFIPTYEALYHTMIANYLAATGFDQVPEHRFFIVREPQAFWRYDGTLDWPQGYYEKNEVHRRVADRWGIPIVDLWADSGINISTRGWFIQNENIGQLFIHINDKGGRQVANVFRYRMLQHPPLDFTADTDGAYIALPTAAGDLGPWRADNVV